MPKGIYERRPQPIAERIAHYTSPEPNSGCLLWTGYVDPQGYGRLNVRNVPALAHRLSYELAKGPIPDGLTLDHRCRVRCCVNPDHLEPVTLAENTARGEWHLSRGRKHREQTHCTHGHPFDEVNTYWRSDGGRNCRACIRERMRRHRASEARNG